MDTLRVQGALEVMDDLFNEFPKMEAVITPKILGANKWSGHWYGIPVNGSYGGTSGVILRYDLLQKYGVAEPDPMVGWTSIQPYLEAIAKNESTLIPFVVDAGYGPVHENFLLPRKMGKWGGVDGKVGTIIPNIDKGYTLADTEAIQEYIDTATLVRSWWEAGLINKTDVTTSGASGTTPTDYLIPGKAAMVVENSPNWKYYAYQQSMQAAFPNATLKGYDMIGAQVGRNGVRPLGALKQWNFIVYNAGAPKAELEAGVKFYDWLYSSQDNMDLLLMGIDGVNYKKEANMKYSEIPGVDQSKNYRKAWYCAGVPGRFGRYPDDLPADALAEQQWEVTESAWDFDPYEGYNIDLTADNVQTLTAQIQASWAEAYHGFGTGQMATPDAITKMKQTLDNAGRQNYKTEIQKQVNAYIAANKV
jgi:ABC-type glycerol-3-phosphate transport system substrate-binding protein